MKFWILIFLFSSIGQAQQAFLISGGSEPKFNSCDFYNDINKMYKNLKSWKPIVFTDDGQGSSSKELNGIKCNEKGYSQHNLKGDPILTRLIPQIENAPLYAAKKEELKKIFLEKVKKLKPSEPVLLYFTDHGNNPEPNDPEFQINLWGEYFSGSELRDLINQVPTDHTVITIQDHCYGGGILESLWNEKSKLRANTCGFSATNATDLSYERKTFASVSDSILNQPRNVTFNNLKENALLEIKDSVPTSTSDIFLEKYYAKNLSKITTHNFMSISTASICENLNHNTSLNQQIKNLATLTLAERLKHENDQVVKALIATEYKGNDLLSYAQERYEFVEDVLKETRQKRAHIENARAYELASWISIHGGEKLQNSYAGLMNQIDEKKKLSLSPQNSMAIQQLWDQANKIEVQLKGIGNKSKYDKTFLKAQANLPQSLEKKEKELHENFLKLRRLVPTQKRILALQALSKNGSLEDINTYLNLINCENTVARKMIP